MIVEVKNCLRKYRMQRRMKKNIKTHAVGHTRTSVWFQRLQANDYSRGRLSLPFITPWREWMLRNIPSSSKRLHARLLSHSPNAHFLKLKRSLSANSLLRQASASPRWRMNPAKAIISFIPVVLPFSSTYQIWDRLVSKRAQMWSPSSVCLHRWGIQLLDEVNGIEGLPGRSQSEQRRGPWRWWVCWWLSTCVGCRYPQYFLRRLASLLITC